MAVSISQLFVPSLLTASAVTIYTVPTLPATSTLARGRIRFSNTDTVTRAVTAYAIQSGGSAVAGNCFLNAESISANAYLDIDLPVLAAGGFIQALADLTNKVSVSELDGVIFS